MKKSEETSLAVMERAAVLLAEANTIQEVKEFRSLALSAQVYAKQKGLGKESQDHCYAYASRALIKLGTMLNLTQDQRAKGTRGQLRGSLDGSGRTSVVLPEKTDTPTLAELGLTRKEASEAQLASSLPADQQEALIHRKLKLTEARRQKRRKGILEKLSALPKGKFRVIYADPPWEYSDQRAAGDHRDSTAAADHYPTMTWEALKVLDVKSLRADDAVLFLWGTFPLLPQQLTVLSAWGFTYKTAFVWQKSRGSFGHYHKADAELLLIGTHGTGTPDTDKRESQIIVAATEGHSRKPEIFRNLIESMYVVGPYVELFARGPAKKGWVNHGNEAE